MEFWQIFGRCLNDVFFVRDRARARIGDCSPLDGLGRMKQLLVTAALVLAPLSAVAHEAQRYGLPEGIGNRNPANPWESAPSVPYRSLTTAIKSYRPVDPLPWDELNRRVAPRPAHEPSRAPHRHE
jgi:hypothetical protein